MCKISLLIFSCLLLTHCFSQTNDISDSIASAALMKKNINTLSTSPIVKTSLNIFPNPAKNKISIQITGFNPGIAVVKIIDTKGKICRQDNRLLTDGSEAITMFLMLQPGIYFISVSEKNKIIKKKMAIF